MAWSGCFKVAQKYLIVKCMSRIWLFTDWKRKIHWHDRSAEIEKLGRAFICIKSLFASDPAAAHICLFVRWQSKTSGKEMETTLHITFLLNMYTYYYTAFFLLTTFFVTHIHTLTHFLVFNKVWLFFDIHVWSVDVYLIWQCEHVNMNRCKDADVANELNTHAVETIFIYKIRQ